MSNIDNIINKLKQEAEEKIELIENDANKKASSIKSELIENAKAEKERILRDAKAKADTTFDRINESTEIRIRDKRLLERQKLIDRVLALAIEKMSSVDDETFINQVKDALSKTGDKDLTLRVPKSRLEAAKKSDLNVKVDEENFVNNGFILTSDKMNYNYKYEDLINDVREELGPEIINFFSQ